MAHAHPNSIFRWEDAASLEHACWQCPTKANSPRALQTCYGTHSMPCMSYHPTMHAVGAAHRCSGCVTTREMHDARHREIAELVAEYKSLESTEPPEILTRIPLLDRSVNINAARQPRPERNPFELGIAPVEDAETAFGVPGEEIFEVDDDETSFSSYAPSSADTLTTPVHKLTKAEQRAQKKAKKSAKSQNKALKNRNRNLASLVLADVNEIAEILHGEEQDATSDGSAHPLATDKTIEDVMYRNLNFVKNIQAHKQYLFTSVVTGRKEIKERKRQKKRETRGEITEDAVDMDEVVHAIMIKLGISPTVVSASASSSATSCASTPQRSTPNSSSSGRKRANSNLSITPANGKAANGAGASRPTIAIANKLRAAIKTDLEKHENEVHARYVRAGGFWRYVGRTVFERMTEIARELDVGSGERWEKKRVREGKERPGSKNAEVTPEEKFEQGY